MHRVVVILALALLASAALQLRAPSEARSAGSAVLDQTFSCAPSLIGGVHKIETRAYRGSGRKSGSWNRPAFAGVETTVSESAPTVIENELFWVAAGRPSADATVVTAPWGGFTFPFRSWGTVAVNGKLCRPSTARVPLTKAGLRASDVGLIDDRWDCTTGRSVLVHVRATLSSDATLRLYRGFLRTTGTVNRASFAVRTATGKSLVYAEVSESGKSALHTSPMCFPD